MTENNKYKHYRLDIGFRKEAAYLNCKFSFLFLYFLFSMYVEVNTFECQLKTQKIKALELDLKGLFENTKLKSFLLVLNKKNPGWSVV